MLKALAKKAIEMTGYTFMNLKVLRDPQRQKPITPTDFYNLYFSKINPSEFFFVQIGANDGVANDPIRPYVTKYGLSGIAVEPQKDVFDKLKENYAPYKNVTCVNAAIARSSGSMPFYTVKESLKTEKDFARVTGISSFDRSVFLKTVRNKLPAGAMPEEFMQISQVEALSFADLANRHSITRIDLLQMDCEGYDGELLKAFDFERFSPSLINFESMHFSDTLRKECEELLSAHGYATFRTRCDTSAYRF